MNNSPLTRLQRDLIKEIDAASSLLGLDPQEIVESCSGEERTERLRNIRNHIIRGEVITAYTLIDAFLEGVLTNYYFRQGRTALKNPRRSKKLKNFSLMLEEMSLMQKLRQAKSIKKFPSGILRIIERMNALRNGLAHSFHSSNRYPPNYKGEDIFSYAGLELFVEDMQKIWEFFYPILAELEEENDSPPHVEEVHS